MKMRALIVLIYSLAVTGLIVTVKVAKAHAVQGKPEKAFLASCDDPPPTTNPGSNYGERGYA